MEGAYLHRPLGQHQAAVQATQALYLRRINFLGQSAHAQLGAQRGIVGRAEGVQPFVEALAHFARRFLGESDG